jgi:hypothetical protein
MSTSGTGKGTTQGLLGACPDSILSDAAVRAVRVLAVRFGCTLGDIVLAYLAVCENMYLDGIHLHCYMPIDSLFIGLLEAGIQARPLAFSSRYGEFGV